MEMKPQRIAVIGISASGKSTLSRKLAEQTGLPLYHMDILFWKGNWEAVPEAEYLREHEKLVARDRWIIEGYIDPKMKSRLERADLIIYLDYSGLRAAWQLIKRLIKFRGQSRPELPAEALESFDSNFFKTVLTRGERPQIERAVEDLKTEVIRLRKPADLSTILSNYEQRQETTI